MGYAIFTFRKLMLTNRVNNLNYRLMVLSQRKQTMSDHLATMQQQQGIQTAYMGMMFKSAMNQSIFGVMQGPNMAPEQRYFVMQQVQQEGMMKQQMANMFVQAQNEQQLQGAHLTENAIDMEMKAIETQIKAAQKELESVEKAEDKQIEQSTPKYSA